MAKDQKRSPRNRNRKLADLIKRLKIRSMRSCSSIPQKMTSAERNHIIQTMRDSVLIVSYKSYEYEKSEEALSTLPSLFNNASYSDVTIRLGTNGEEIPAHRIILAIYSPLLNDTLSRNPKTDLEFSSDDCSPYSYWRILHYIYRRWYPAEATRECTEVLGSTGRW